MQELSKYLSGRNKGEFARRVNITPAYLSQILSTSDNPNTKKKRPSYELMVRIEKETLGEVPLSAWIEEADAA